jgi:putative transposase
MNGELLRRICGHIAENAANKNIRLDRINGSADHLHALIFLRSDQTIANVAQLLKGESSHWVNKETLGRLKFEWQNDYFAESVSWSALSSVRRYIEGQEEHHRKKSFSEEFAEFMEDQGVMG